MQLVLVFITIFFAVSVLAQNNPDAGNTDATTITSNANEVSMNIVVRSKKNKPVLDLKPEDIAVSDNGTAVKVSSLRLIDANSDVDRYVTMVFDQMQPSAATNARNIADKILKAIPQKGFSLSVMGVDGRLKLYQEFTSDRAALSKAVTSVTEQVTQDSIEPEKRLIKTAQSGADASGAVVSLRDRDMAKVTMEALQESQRIVQDQHIQGALAGLIALSRTERQIDGRKIVIFFAQSLHGDINTHDVLLSIVGSANRAGLTIYTVDTNAVNAEIGQGLVATIALGNMQSAQAQIPVFPTSNIPPPVDQPVVTQGLSSSIAERFDRSFNEGLAKHTEPLAFLAESTGGGYMTASDNLRKPLERFLEDVTTYYEVSYVPPIQQYDGRFRATVVHPVHEKLKIQSRAGYFALPPGSNGGSIRPFETPLLAALAQPEMPNNINFRSAVLRLGELPDGNANELIVEVPLSEVDMKEDVNTKLFSLHLAVVAQVKNKAGVVVEHFSEDIPRHGGTETITDTRSQVITVQRHFAAPPGDYVLETAVMDRNNGKLSAQRSDFNIAPIPVGAYLSDLSVVRRTDPFTWEADPLEPMRYQNGKVVPNLSGSMGPDSQEVSFFLMIHPDPSALEPARLEMEVRRNGESLTRLPLPLRATSGLGAVPYLASIQSKSLPPGKYEVATILTQNGNTSERSIELMVGGPQLASATTNNALPPAGSAHDIEQPDSGVQSSALRPMSHPIVISSLPTTSMSAPSPEKLATMISNTRERAIGYAKSLPNFVCTEVTDRSVDSSGQGRWKRQDTIAELLRYRDHTETRSTLEVNGHRSSTNRDEMNGTLNHGEFGGVLDAVFSESAKAEFQWKETAVFGTEKVEVLSYHVEQKNSSFGLNGSNGQINPGFHGFVYVDTAANGIRRITMEADPIPTKLAMKAASVSVDYDYISIGEHEYLLPIRASASLTQGKKSTVNNMMFRDYRRYGAKSKITSGAEPVKH